MNLASAVKNLEKQFGRMNIGEPLMTPEEMADAQAILDRMFADPVGNAIQIRSIEAVLAREQAVPERRHA